MKLFKKKSTLVVKQVAKKKLTDSTKSTNPNGKPLLAWIYQPALLAVVFMAMTAALLELLVIQSVEIQQQSRIKSILSASVKQNVDNYIHGRERELTALAKTALVRRALANELDFLDVNTVLSTMLGDLERLYLVPENSLQGIGAANPELSFASLDILTRAATGKPAKAEAFFHQDVWMFQVAAPVLSESGELTGVILALFNTSAIEPLLRVPAGAPAGKVSLSSRRGAQSKVVLAQGTGISSQSISVDTIIAQWQVSYAPEVDQLPVLDRTLIWIIMAISGLVLALLIFILCRANVSRLRSDLIRVTQYLRTLLSGDSPKKLKTLFFAEIYSMAMAVKQSSKEYKKQGLKPKNVGHTGGDKGDDQRTNDKIDSSDTPLFDDDLLDLDVLSEAESGLDPQEANVNSAENAEQMVTEVEQLNVEVPQSIFRAYDIRGIVDETLNEAIVELIGKALASEALSRGQAALCIGYDGRLSNTSYCDAITRGIISTGVDAIIIGQVPTPTLYFATHYLETGSGVMITGSHNPGNYNGFKMMLGGTTLADEDIQKLYNRILLQDFAEGQGVRSNQSVDRDYLSTILNDIAVAAPLKVVLDAGNGVAGDLAPALIEELGCEVIPLFCEVDGNFPNHHPDPGKPENLQDLIAAVKTHEADIGLAFDGDGDRVGVVTNTGKIIWPDRLLMLFAKDVVSRNPGADVIFDVKCSRRLNGLISRYGGRPIMWKTGHSLIKAKMMETGALLAGEMSGHVFFKERWFGFDDGLYSAARLLEILGAEDRSSDEVFADFPEDVSTPEINIPVTDETKFVIADKLCALKAQFDGGNVSTIDGLRVDYPNGWGLCRASNTTPVLVLRFEADDEEALEDIKRKFKAQLSVVEPELNLDF